MGYLGTPPQSGFITTAKQRVTSSTNNYVDLDHAISSIADVIVFVNFVKQDTTNLSLTTSTRITLGGTLVSSDIVEIHYLGKAVNTQTPGTGTVTNDMLAGSINNDKLAGNIANDKLANSSITLNGSAVSLGGSATVGGDNQPYFFANTSDTTSYSDATTTQVNFNSEQLDVGGCYNNTGSTVTLNGVSAPAYSFAPNVAGKYYFSTTMQCYSSSGQLGNALVMLFKNTSQFAGASANHSGSGPYVESIQAEGIVELNGTSDYVLAKVYIDVGTGTAQLLAGATRNMFQGFKLI